MFSVKVEDLVCRSLIELYRDVAPERIVKIARPDGAMPVSVVHIENVLYLRGLRAPIVDNIMPAESILNSWHLEFERSRNFLIQEDFYREPFEYIYSDKEVCILSNLYSENFFHWLTEEAIRVLVMEKAGFSGHYVVRGGFVPQCMEMLGIAQERVIEAPERPTVFRSGWFATAISADDIPLYPDLFLDLRARLIAASTRSRLDYGARMWIDRDDKNVENAGRELINKDEVYPLLERYDFHILDMAKLPVVDQIAVASRASIIGGTHGAGFVHVLFMKEKSRVIECFTPNLINSGIVDICRLLRHRYAMVVPNNAYGSYPFGMQLKLDVRQLELILQGLDL